MTDQTQKTERKQQKQNEQFMKVLIMDERFRKEIQEFSKCKFIVEDIDKLSQALRSQDIVQQHYGIMGIKQLLYEQVPAPIQQIIDAGIAPIISTLARQTEYPHIQRQAAAALAIIPTGNEQHCQIFQELDGVAIIAQLLKSHNKTIVEQAVYIFSYLLEDSYQLSIIRKAGVETLVNALHKMTEKTLINCCCFAINSLCREKPSINQKDSCLAIFTLCEAIAQEKLRNRQIILNLFYWVLFSKQNKKEKRQAIIKSGVLVWMVRNLEYFQRPLLFSTLSILINVSTNNPQVVGHLLSLNILQHLQKVFNKKEKDIKQSMKLLKTMALAGFEYAETILNKAGLMKCMIDALKSNNLFVKHEAFKLFSGIAVYDNCKVLFEMFQTEDIIKNTVDLLLNKLLMMQMLQNFLRLLSFGESFKVKDENLLLKQFCGSGGKQILQKLSIMTDQKVLDTAMAILCLINRKQEE